jgi:23S rRNA (pseudouridine1915-N3)-methyltransferase
MRIVLLSVGRMKQGPERDLLSRYAERAKALVRGVGLTGFELREIDESRARQPNERKREEAKAIELELAPGARVAVLDERGRSLGSQAFAEEIGRARDNAVAEFVLVIGGPDGVAEALRDKADLCIAYGAATFPHQIVRILAAEQIYRAVTILAGHPYHRQ